MNALPAFIPMYHLCAWCPQNLEEVTGVTMAVSLYVGAGI